MGPRTFARGEQPDGYSFMGNPKLQWGRALLRAESALVILILSDLDALQWGRALLRAERAQR